MLVTLIVIAVIAVLGIIIWKRGDQDGDGDFDLDDIKVSAEEIAADIKEGVEDAVEDVKEWADDVSDEIKDVIDTIRNKPTKANLNKLTKAQLIAAAQDDHNVELDPKAKKSVLVNKVYSLYN